MPLMKYQIRNEYSLADPELYRAADKDDPEALLEGVAMAGLVGVLRQLGDLAEFAAGIFHDLHEEVMATAARGHGLMIRIQQLEAEVAPIEKAFLSRTSHSLFIYNAGVDWHPNLRTDQIMITRGDLPRFVRDSYEECRGPPRLFLLDKFDIAGAGACLKRYSDPSFFKAQLNFSETTKADFQKEKKTRIIKKKGSRCRNGEKPDVFPTSHAKLHQLFSEERRQNEKNVFMPHVKLKKRQSNGSLFDSTTGKGYMERFLETHSPERKIAYESSLGPLNLNMKSNNSSELGLEIREISTGSPVNKLLRRERGADSSFNRQEAVLESSMYDLYEDAIKEGILENFPESITFIEVEKNPSSFYKAGDQKESMVDLEIKTEAIADGYQSDDINSEVDNYLDALTTMESEMETDTDIRPKYERGFFNTERQGLDSDANEEHQMLQAQFSGTHFIENSSASDDGNNVFKKGRSSFSYSNTLSNLDENPPSDGDGVAKVCTSTETCPTEFIDKFSKELSRDGDALVTESLEYVVPCSSFNEVSENPSYRSELVESSSSSCVTDSSSTLPHLSQGANLNGFELLGPESIEISSDCPKFDMEGSSSNTDADGKNLFGDLPCTTSVSDFSFQMTDYLRPMQFAKGQPVEEMDGRTGEVSSDALWQLSNILDVALEKKYVAKTLDVVSSTECAENGSTETLMNGKLELPHPVTLPTEKQLSVLAGQDLEACSGTTQPERSHGSISPGDLNDGNPDKRVSKTDTSIRTTGANSEYLTSVLDVLDTSDFTEQDFLEMKDEVLPPDLKLENGNGCSGVKALDNNLDVLSNTFESGVKDEPEIDVVQMNSCASVGKAAVPLEFPSICVVSGSPKPATATDFHSQLNNLVNGTVHLEADNDITMCPNLIVGPSGKHMTLQEECPSSNRDLGDLVAEDHSQSDNLVTGIVHAEACGDDTSVCPNLIGSPSKNHVKVLEECPSNLDLGNLLTEANSQLDNLVTGTVDAEADGADTADYPNLNCDLSGNHIKLQEECPSSGDSARYKREIFEACNPKCIIESESRKETNQLAVASTELNFELCNPEFFDPSSSELPNDVHNSLLVEHVQNDFHLMDVTRTSTSLKESDQELKSAHHSYLSESADNSNLSATHSLQEPGVLSEQTLKSEADQLIVGSLHEDGGSFMPFNLRYEPAESLTRRVEDGCVSAPSELSWVISLKEPSEPQFSSTTANHKIDSSETAIDCSDSIVSSIGTFPGAKQPAEPPPSRSVLDLPLPDPEAGQANLEMPPLPPLPPMQWRRIGQLLRQGSLASEGEMVQPSLNPFSPQLAATAHGKAQQGFPTLVGEIAQPLNLFLPLSSLEDKKSQHGSEALRGEMVQAGLNPFSSQLPVMVDDANSQQGSITSEGKRIHPPKPNPILPSPALEDENPQHGSLTSGGEMGQFASLPTIEDTRLAFSLHGQLDEVQNPLASKSITEDGMLQHTSLTKEGVEWPLNSFAPPPTSKDEKPPHGSLTLEGEMVWPSKESALLPTVEVGMPNGNLAKKLPRPRDPLIEAVASHDKSMLRKVTERVQSLSGPNVDERDSLLEQIRAKSFNLKPAATTRPSLHGPKTNLKVAAILEKANAIRQALAGSDEDDDGDSWSDS